MPKKSRIAQACKAATGFGISAAKVKAAVKELLKVYDNQWEFIEDDHYRLLLDFLLENKEENEPLENKTAAPHSNVEPKVKSKRKAGLKLDNNQVNEPPTKRLRTRSRHKSSGSQSPKNFDTLQLVEVPLISTQYDDLDTNMLSDTQKFYELEDSGLVRKRPQRKWAQQGEAEPSELCIEGEQTKSHSASYPQEAGIDAKKPSSYQSFQTVGQNEPSYKRAGLDYVFSRKRSKTLALSVIPNEKEVFGGEDNSVAAKDLWSNHFLSPTDALNVLDMYRNPLNCLTEEPWSCSELHAPCIEYWGEESPRENFSEVQKVDSKLLHPEFLSKDAKVSNGTKTNEAHFDIASSLNGEVKISLIYDSSQQPNLSVPCLDDVLKATDEKCRESYEIMAPGFTAKLMMKICDCFLAMGTYPVNTLPTNDCTLTSCKKLDQDCQTSKIGLPCRFGISPSLSMESFKVWNLFKVVPEIPIRPFPAWLDNIQYFVSFGTECTGFNLLEQRRIKFVKSQIFSSKTPENMGAAESNHSSLVAKSIEYVVDINIGEESLKISFANGNFTKFFNISNEGACSSYAVNCLSSWIPCSLAHETWCKCPCNLEITVKKELLEELISMNRDAEEWRFLCCKKLQLSCCENRKILNVCGSDLARMFSKEQLSKYRCDKTRRNAAIEGCIPVNLQIEGSSEVGLMEEG